MLISACYRNDLDLDILDQEWISEWTIPLLSTTFKINDIQDLDSFIGTNPDGKVEIHFRKDSLINESINPYMDIIPPQPLQFDSLSLSDPSAEKWYEFGVIDDIQLQNISFHQGKLNISFHEDVPIGTRMELEILHAQKEGIPAVFIFSKSANSNGKSESIKGYTIDLGKFEAPNFMGYRIRLLEAPGNPLDKQVRFQWKFEDVLIEEAIGYFGARAFDLPSGNFNIEKSDLLNITNGLQFQDATFSFALKNPVGVPFEFRGSIITERNGVTTRRQLPSIYITAAESSSLSSINKFEFSASELLLTEILKEIPDKIAIDGILVANPSGDISVVNFANRDRELLIDFELKLPLNFRAEGVVFNLPNRSLSQIRDLPGNLLHADLQLTNINSFPFDADFKLLFLDSEGTLLDSLLFPLIQAASISASGRVINPVKYVTNITLDSLRLDNIRKSSWLSTQIFLHTPTNEQSVVIYNDYSFKTNLAMNATLSTRKPN